MGRRRSKSKGEGERGRCWGRGACLQELATTNEALNLTAQLFACQAFIKFTVLLDQQLGVNYGLSLGQWACLAGVPGTQAATVGVAIWWGEEGML